MVIYFLLPPFLKWKKFEAIAQRNNVQPKPTENKGKQIAHICIWLGYLQTEINILKSLDVFIDMTIDWYDIWFNEIYI